MARLPLAAPLLIVSLPALAPAALAQSAATDLLPPRPAAPLRAAVAEAALPGFVPADSLSDDQLARRLARLYERQADLLDATADGDVDRTATTLDALVADLQLLGQRPGVMFDARFRDAYSAILTEHERFYQAPMVDRGDVYAFREAGVDAVERGFDMGVPLLEHVTLPDRSTYATTIPMDVNTQVERYVQFLTRRPSHVERLLSRAETYFPMVERVLAEEGVPDELKYLAMVESALNPAAQSHAGAAGMWQFIRATGAAYGLEATRDYDDRLDPERATRAAARHLRDLHDRFGDWQLALAGYNCNPAVIARAARRHEERTGQRATFWDIETAIPRETRAYVPMFIATSLVVSNPAAYNMSPSSDPGPEYAFDRIPVEGGTSLGAVARVLGVSEAAIRALNPSLRSGRVPSRREAQTLRIPPGLYAENRTDLDRFAPPSPSGLRAAAETVQFGPRAIRPVAPQERGEALQVAAARATRRTTDRPVRRDNPVEQYAAVAPPEVAAFEARQARPAPRPEAQPDALALAREELIALRAAIVAEQNGEPVEEAIEETVEAPVEAPVAAARPAVREALPASAPAAAAPALVAQAEAPRAPAPRLAPPSAPAPQVQSAGLLGPDVFALAAARPAAEPEEEEVQERGRAEAPPARTRVPVRVVSDRAERRPATHTVQRGEYLTTIAREYGVTVQQLREWNDGVDGDRLFAGRRLVVSEAGAPARRTAPAAPATPRTYRVQAGDNLTRIAQRFGVSVSDLQQWNGLTSGTIRAGQTLRLRRPTRG